VQGLTLNLFLNSVSELKMMPLDIYIALQLVKYPLSDCGNEVVAVCFISQWSLRYELHLRTSRKGMTN